MEIPWSVWCMYTAKYQVIGLRTGSPKGLVTLLYFHSISQPLCCLYSHRNIYFVRIDLYFPVFSLVDESVLCLFRPS